MATPAAPAAPAGQRGQCGGGGGRVAGQYGHQGKEHDRSGPGFPAYEANKSPAGWKFIVGDIPATWAIDQVTWAMCGIFFTSVLLPSLSMCISG